MWELIGLGIIIVLLFWIKEEIGNGFASLRLLQTDLMHLQSKDLDEIKHSTFLTQKRLTDLLVENRGHGNGEITYNDMMRGFFETDGKGSKLNQIHYENRKINNSLDLICRLLVERKKDNSK